MAIRSKVQIPAQLFSLLAFFPAFHVLAQTLSTQAAMHDRVVSLYSFSPHMLPDAARKEKSAQMDAFWSEVKAHQDIELPLLRLELDNGSNPPFFFADGSGLLLSFSRNPSDEALAAVAMARTDLVDVNPAVYFDTVHQLSMDGIDTTSAALHVLDGPTFAVSIPAHAITLDKRSVLLYLLLPVSQDKWIEAARSRFAIEKDETAQKALLTLFFYAQTSPTDQMINAAAIPGAFSETILKDAQRYQMEAKEALKEKTDVTGSEDAVREDRRKRLSDVSNESIGDIQDLTTRLIQLRYEQTHSSSYK